MNDAQIWSIVGVLAGGLGTLVVAVTLMLRFALKSVETEISSLRNEMNTRFDAADKVINTRFKALEDKIQDLDGDVQAIVNRWGKGA